MKIDQIFSSHGGENVLAEKDQVLEDIKVSLTNSHVKFEKGEAPYIKAIVNKTLTDLGWADSVKIPPTNLTVNFVKRRVGLCLQLGNVARTYADLLKLQVLFEKQIIEVGVIALPIRSNSIKLGSNAAQYERLKEEVKLFENIIKVPLVLIGIST